MIVDFEKIIKERNDVNHQKCLKLIEKMERDLEEQIKNSKLSKKYWQVVYQNSSEDLKSLFEILNKEYSNKTQMKLEYKPAYYPTGINSCYTTSEKIIFSICADQFKKD